MAKAVIRKPKKKVCQFCKEKATGVDYKDTALLRKPGLAEAHQMRGEAWLAKGEPDKAWTDVEAAMNADPENVTTLVLRGRVREALRVQAEAGGPLERLDGN